MNPISTPVKKLFIRTFGCQMNEHDTQKMYALLAPQGYRPTTRVEEADLILVNTCSIREKSYHKALSEVGRSRKKGKEEGIIGIVGCVASQEGEALMKRFPFVKLVVGTDHLTDLPKLVSSLSHQEKVVQSESLPVESYRFPENFDLGIRPSDALKAFVTIIKGCDNVCSFCIVPRVRGKEVSRLPGEIVGEIQKLHSQGAREVMLLGQNVNAYGKKLSPRTSFPELLRKIDEETGIERLRFTSPHPQDLSDGLIEEYRINQKLCRHIHLPVQSGSTSVLKKMRRSYTREVYLRKVNALKTVCPGLQISTDIIVGFPGETEEDFEQTLSLLREVRFQLVYSFTYSPRPGTEAFSFVDDVPLSVKEERLKILQDLQEEIGLEINRDLVGKTVQVLVEGSSRQGESGGEKQFMGRTSENHLINFTGQSVQKGAIVPVAVQEALAYSLKGVLV
ncbi:MAG: tRNA (N6-isopentenyl adenosine(37)-C2)-methylthiotransferase MiaB [bacterium]|nr:tRNA (N6-isopentenyl adenosine(37)-C2)-methylthiotransferase MiaB [bacterium]